MTTTTRVVRDQVKNTLDYLHDSGLALSINEVSMIGSRVSWHAHDRSTPFLFSHDHATVDQYMRWVAAGAYSAVLFDGSLLQFTYDVEGGSVSGHRLAYFPCPYDVDPGFLAEGDPIGDIVDAYRDGRDPILRTPIRFDYSPTVARSGHAPVHFTINAPSCRIACIAPLHVLRFVDFVFRHFYPDLWHAHRPFFAASAWLHIGPVALSDDEHGNVHIMWDPRATATSFPTGG